MSSDDHLLDLVREPLHLVRLWREELERIEQTARIVLSDLFDYLHHCARSETSRVR